MQFRQKWEKDAKKSERLSQLMHGAYLIDENYKFNAPRLLV